jgi:enoyl-CoA hydratase/carnithine racemase
MNDRVSLDITDHVAVVTLDRADKYNAVDLAMIDGIVAAGEAVAADADVRAVVLTGSGEHFCAGVDLGIFQSPDSALSPKLMAPQEGGDANYFQRPATIWRDLPVPVIAALHGICYGAGLQIAFGADIRIASPESRLSVMEVKWGIIPDMGMTVTARGIMRPDRLKELAMTGRVLDGAAALALGVVTEVATTPLERAMELAREIAGKNPDAIAAIKMLLNEAIGAPVSEALRLEARLQQRVMSGANQAEAARANFEKRAPEFQPRKQG